MGRVTKYFKRTLTLTLISTSAVKLELEQCGSSEEGNKLNNKTESRTHVKKKKKKRKETHVDINIYFRINLLFQINLGNSG